MGHKIYGRVVSSQAVQSQYELLCDLLDEHPNFCSFRPRYTFTSDSLKTERVSPDAVCRTYGRLGFLSGSPAAMSGLAMVTDAPVPTVFIRPSLFWLPSLLLTSICTYNVNKASVTGELIDERVHFFLQIL
jgi:hypothetical protein